MSRRSQIVHTLAEKLKLINGTGIYTSNLFSNVFTRRTALADINDYPTVQLSAGTETREYHPDAFKWGFLNISIFIYIDAEDTIAALEPILEDIETVLDSNNDMIYDGGVKKIEQISIVSISTDEGLLTPLGIGEIRLLVRYTV
jgi:hypothetical protein